MTHRAVFWSVCLFSLSSVRAFGAVTSDVELHSSTTSLSPASAIHSSTMTPSGVTSSTATTTLSDPQKINQLSLQLKSTSSVLRAQAIRELGNGGAAAKSEAPSLAALLTDRELGTQAARALHKVDPAYAVSPTVFHVLVRRAKAAPEESGMHNVSITRCESQTDALDVLAALGPQAHATLPDLVKLTHRFCVHDHVVAALDQLGPPSDDQIKQIASGVQDRDPETREAAVAYLAKSDPNVDTIRTLGRAMNDSDSGVRLSALQALEDIHPEGEGRLPLLAVFAQDPSPDIRARAVYMVGQLGPDALRAAPLLRDRLKDPEPAIALTSAKFLARLDPQDDRLITALIGFMKDKGSAQAMQAAKLLESLQIHDARVDAALDPYRTQQSLWERFSKSSSIPPEQLTDNGRTLTVDNLKMASGIVQDQPIGVSRHFPSTVGRVYCWTEVSVSSAPAALLHRWFRNGHLHHEEYFDVSASQVRLWSSAAGRAGDWKVEVIPLGAHDPIATAVFTVAKKKS